jgi:hypothetical protein
MFDLNEASPLIESQTSRSPTFLQRIRTAPVQIIKKLALAGVSAFSGYMYWPSSFNAAAFGGEALQVTAALGGITTQASRYAHEKFWPSCPQNLFASRD